jgi:hypothetical protein
MSIILHETQHRFPQYLKLTVLDWLKAVVVESVCASGARITLIAESKMSTTSENSWDPLLRYRLRRLVDPIKLQVSSCREFMEGIFFGFFPSLSITYAGAFACDYSRT